MLKPKHRHRAGLCERRAYRAITRFRRRCSGRLSKGLSANAGYTYAHEIDDATGLAATGTAGYGTYITSPTTYIQSIQSYDRSTGDFNIGHRGFLAANYELPKANVNHVLATAINGWQVNSTIVWQSGLPLPSPNATSRAGITGLTGERPNRVLSNLIVSQSDRRHHRAVSRPQCLCTAALYTLGNAGRNIGAGPRSSFINASLFKTFGLPTRPTCNFEPRSSTSPTIATWANRWQLSAPRPSARSRR